MHGSQRVATAIARASSSLVLVSRALDFSAACAVTENPFITSGIPARTSRSRVEKSRVIALQSVMTAGLRSGVQAEQPIGRAERDAGGGQRQDADPGPDGAAGERPGGQGDADGGAGDPVDLANVL